MYSNENNKTIKKSKVLKYLEFVLIVGSLTSDNKASVLGNQTKIATLETRKLLRSANTDHRALTYI